MNVIEQRSSDPRVNAIIKLAIMAVGGQGGGVLTNWIEDCARANGYAVQATSVAGVAQRTGATIYYIEMAPQTGKPAVFSLMPAAGDVDILVAAEMMEAGRAILRGFVTPGRTTLIASSHRALAVSEKTVPGDGMASSAEVLAAAEVAAQRFIHFDMQEIAADSGTVISASLLGALAGSGTLPFSREQFEDAIRASGRGVDASLKAFARAFSTAIGKQEPSRSEQANKLPDEQIAGPETLLKKWRNLEHRARELPAQVHEYALPGLRAVVDYQDIAYGREYLDRLDKVQARDSETREFELTRQAAKYLARAMTYDDVIRVADLKTHGNRFERIRGEMNHSGGKRMMLTEFMHPRAEEIVGMFPAGMGHRVSASPRAIRLIDRLFNKGRRLRTDRLLPFLQLYLLGGLKRWRRGTLRHEVEMAHLEDWMNAALNYLEADYNLAVEIIRNRRLIKGYSDTYARGRSKFDKVMHGAALVAGRSDAADWVRRLREAALQDEKGSALDGALKTVESFALTSQSH